METFLNNAAGGFSRDVAFLCHQPHIIEISECIYSASQHFWLYAISKSSLDILSTITALYYFPGVKPIKIIVVKVIFQFSKENDTELEQSVQRMLRGVHYLPLNFVKNYSQ